MELLITLPDYDGVGYEFQWEPNFEIKVTDTKDYIHIAANKEGLISLAKQLLYLAQDHFFKGYHLHYDDYGGLEEGSKEMVIEKI